jgi:hypothetical protein
VFAFVVALTAAALIASVVAAPAVVAAIASVPASAVATSEPAAAVAAAAALPTGAGDVDRDVAAVVLTPGEGGRVTQGARCGSWAVRSVGGALWRER